MAEFDPLQPIREDWKRGERELAKKKLADLLLKNPGDEKAWMLMARLADAPKQKRDCYERAIKINPGNVAAKKELVRLDFPGYTYDPRRGVVAEASSETAGRFKLFMRLSFLGLAVFAILISGTLAYARSNPDSQIAQMLPELPALPNLQKYNLLQYESPEEALIAFAKDAANQGMDGAPAQPGYWIDSAPGAAEDITAEWERALPQPGNSSTLTADESQATSIAARILWETPDLPARDVQVYFRDGQILVWCMVDGDVDSTSALASATLDIGADGIPALNILSAQVGQTAVPEPLLTKFQTEFNRELGDQLRAEQPHLRVTGVYIDGGLLTMTLER